MTVEIRVGDCRELLRAMPAESVQCVVTSPPYWGLRSYQGGEGMIGLEPTFDEHLGNLVEVFREVRRVLRADGTCWLNYGDAYARNGGTGSPGPNAAVGTTKLGVQERNCSAPAGLKPKDLMLMPARVALALQADGWWVRSEVVWHKPNPMPESVTDRPTSSHEKLFLLTKSARYFYDAEAVRAAWSERSVERHKPGSARAHTGWNSSRVSNGNRQGSPPRENERQLTPDTTKGANLRNVWTIPTHSYSEAHFATFPPKLVEPCILAGTSAKGCCAECGAPWARVISDEAAWKEQRSKLAEVRDDSVGGKLTASWASNTPGVTPSRRTVYWLPSCKCGADTKPCVVLDPFAGAGTVGLVADRLNRDAILLELSPEYAEMARERIVSDAPLLAEVTTC